MLNYCYKNTCLHLRAFFNVKIKFYGVIKWSKISGDLMALISRLTSVLIVLKSGKIVLGGIKIERG